MIPEDFSSFLKGFAIGFGIAAPVGPIGLLCVRRSILDGRAAGFVSGLGAASADALYGLVAALGLTAVTQFLLDHRAFIQLGGGVFLLYLGFSLFRAKPPRPSPGPTQTLGGLTTAYTSTFGLTLTNPATILSFIGIFAGLGLAAETTTRLMPAALLVVGVFLGSTAWWFILSSAAHWFGGKLGPRRFRVVNYLSGALLTAFGLWQLASVL